MFQLRDQEAPESRAGRLARKRDHQAQARDQEEEGVRLARLAGSCAGIGIIDKSKSHGKYISCTEHSRAAKSPLTPSGQSKIENLPDARAVPNQNTVN